ncbi:MAG: hypothetical protein N3D16_00095 [Anaerolineales bacterium]|nr:hypothetical protein [Anaerolineales bacterium]
MLANAAYIFPEAQECIVALGQAGRGSGNFTALYDTQSEQTPLASNANAKQIAAYLPNSVLLKI